jgi:hypothetical protein
MRVHQAIAIVALILIGFGVKLVFFSPAGAVSRTNDMLSIDIAKMQENRNLPVQKMHDMSVVFSTGE